ncbi:hypothetical protein [Haploplasma axanthum]|uniref:Uncharacterized protein n=1 Tax=Haploplasma axanthum TaxID=29552 RepID=A0A449BCV7_HAPAX|nr:hypothetical protein [Haploplasma axanthum]VEU80258.1 Uncharacterised protein [Haploplasma axanthum]
MAKGKNGFVAFMDDLPVLVKAILALPGLDFIWGIYRLVKGISKNNGTLTIVGLLWIFLGVPLLWIIDLVTIILSGRPTVLVD